MNLVLNINLRFSCKVKNTRLTHCTPTLYMPSLYVRYTRSKIPSDAVFTSMFTQCQHIRLWDYRTRPYGVSTHVQLIRILLKRVMLTTHGAGPHYPIIIELQASAYEYFDYPYCACVTDPTALNRVRRP